MMNPPSNRLQRSTSLDRTEFERSFNDPSENEANFWTKPVCPAWVYVTRVEKRRREELVDPETNLKGQQLIDFRDKVARTEMKRRFLSLAFDKWRKGDVKSLQSLFERVGVPKGEKDQIRRISTFMYMHNDPDSLLWITRYLKGTMGMIYEKASLDILNLWRIDHPGDLRFKSELGNLHFLMHGVAKKDVYRILKMGARADEATAGPNSVFGEGIYFQTNSLKAAGFCVPDAYKSERKADHRHIGPADGEVIYIFFCIVAVGKPVTLSTIMSKDEKYLKRVYDRHDTLICKGLTGHTRDIHIGNVNLPMGPFTLLPSDVDLEVLESRQICDDYIVKDPAQVKLRYLAEIRYSKLQKLPYY